MLLTVIYIYLPTHVNLCRFTLRSNAYSWNVYFYRYMQLITRKQMPGGKAASGSMKNKMKNAQALAKGVVRNEDGTFTVPSQKTIGKSYKVTPWAGSLYTCNCPDFERRENVTTGCKHTHAV